MQLPFPAHALLAACALLAAGPAHALSTETSTFSDFQIWVADLAPSDGVAPTATLDPRSRSTVGPVSVMAGYPDWTRQGDSPFGAVSSTGQLDGTGGAGSFAGDPFGDGAVITASAFGGPARDIGFSFAGVAAQPDFQNTITVGAHTQLTFHGLVTLDWNAGSPDGAAYGEVDMSFFSLGTDDQDFLTQRYVTGGFYGFEGDPDGVSGSTATPFAIAFDNDSDAPVDIGYEVAVFANASEFEMTPPPVDEPAGAPALLTGAALLAWVARRRGAVGARAATGCRAPRADPRSR